MKNWFEKSILMASLVALVVLGYYANSIGIIEKLTIEIQRYSGLTSRHILLIALVVCGSFSIGYLMTRVGNRKTT